MAKDAGIRVPPHSEEAEISVLGAMLLDRDAVIAVAEFLEPFHFYDDRHKEIYEAIISLYSERTPVDFLTVSESLKKRKTLKQIGGSSYLAELANKVPTAAHVEHYGKIVKDLATKRAMMTAGAKIVDYSFDEGLAAEELMDRAESEVFSLTQKHMAHTFAPVKATLAESFDRLDELHKMDNGLRGVPTGFADLDNLLAGLQKSNLIILAARPGVGKTSLALNIAQHLAVNVKRPVGIFSLEMSREELVDRLLVAQADIDAWRLKTGKLDEDDFTKLSNAMGQLAEANLYIDDTPALSILEMRTKARRLQVESGIDLLIVDYLQLARSRNLENRVQEVSEISQGLKNIARELKIPVLALSQLSRAVEQRGTKRPQLADLRDSGCLTGDTLIYRADIGERVRIDSLIKQTNVSLVSLQENLKLKLSKASKIFFSGKKQVYEMVLRSGKKIKVSGNHKFKTINGWKRLDELSEVDTIATPRLLPPIRTKIRKLSVNKLIVLAHLIGDGCYVQRQPLHYTNADIKLINIVKTAAEKEFDVNPRVVSQKNWYHLYLASKAHLTHGVHNPIVLWFREMGIYGQHSWEKKVPNIVFQQSEFLIALFLKHLWATDGCIHVNKSQKGPHVRIYYATTSEELARGVCHLLLRLGILSTLKTSTKKGYRECWQIHIQGTQEQGSFLRNVGCVGKKAETMDLALKSISKVVINPNNDVIPKDIWVTIKTLMGEKNLTTREFHKMMGWAYSGTQRYGNGLSRKRLVAVAKVLQSLELENLANSHIYWDKIVSIKKCGIEKVYDITVPKEANFIANDIVVHNSIEQDSDVVMFLWREDEENIENISLDIAKHRNGPLGHIQFRFRGDRIKFYSRDTKHKKE